ncbi:hypothetical protein Ahy_B10g101863 isoform E [Arachis hypogaea]|uniref:Uncharacterized protein n=1 Tax=Arachis hypogaea TaxID=3818 RepID=A0A444X0N3_ARAHY|nr:hypothetical protein Ahy_B10g101863 isoform E [Arachis hypogaea]
MLDVTQRNVSANFSFKESIICERSSAPPPSPSPQEPVSQQVSSSSLASRTQLKKLEELDEETLMPQKTPPPLAYPCYLKLRRCSLSPPSRSQRKNHRKCRRFLLLSVKPSSTSLLRRCLLLNPPPSPVPNPCGQTFSTRLSSSARRPVFVGDFGVQGFQLLRRQVAVVVLLSVEG